MLKEERQDYILKRLHLHHKVQSAELSAMLNVSLDTIRRDLSELAKNGNVVKVHGGAIATSFHRPFQQPQVYAQKQKKEIAKKALRLLKEGMTVLVGGGTVALELARMIPPDFKGTFFTVSPLVALEIAERSTAEVILLGGRLSRDTYLCTGGSVVSQLSEIRADMCFLGTNGLSVQEGITDYHWEVVQVKKAMLRSAHKTALLSIAEKLDSARKLKVCDLKSLAYLITELDPAHHRLQSYAEIVKVL